jgi:hypothetical protein
MMRASVPTTREDVTNGIGLVKAEGEFGLNEAMRKRCRHTALAALNTIEFDGERRIGMGEAAQKLESAGYDLKAVMEEEMRIHRDWGFPRILKEEKVISSEKDYSALWDNCSFSAFGLDKLADAIRSGMSIAPVFYPGTFSRDELVDILVRGDGVPCGTECYGAGNGHAIRKMSASQVPSEREIAAMDLVEMLTRFREINLAVPVPAQLKPSITFTPDSVNPTECGKSPVQLLRETTKGKRYIDPISDILRWCRQYDRMKGDDDYPDRKAVTMYPDHVYDNGRIATLSCYEHNLIFLLGDCRPDSQWEGLGARPAIAYAE